MKNFLLYIFLIIVLCSINVSSRYSEYKLREKEIEKQIIKEFQTMDRDNDNRISHRELYIGAKDLEDDQINDMINKMDKDDDEFIELKEFLDFAKETYVLRNPEVYYDKEMHELQMKFYIATKKMQVFLAFNK